MMKKKLVVVGLGQGVRKSERRRDGMEKELSLEFACPHA